MHESCHAYSYLCLQNEWFHTYKEVTLHVWTSQVTQIVICALRTSDVTHTEKLRYTYGWVMSCIRKTYVSGSENKEYEFLHVNPARAATSSKISIINPAWCISNVSVIRDVKTCSSHIDFFIDPVCDMTHYVSLCTSKISNVSNAKSAPHKWPLHPISLS